MMKYSHSKPRLLFLYTELSGYFLACLKELRQIDDFEIYVIHWDINKEAPFSFSFPEHIKFYPKNLIEIGELAKKIESFEPDFVYCSGWLDKDYLKIISRFKKKIPTVIGVDTPWQNRIKQYVACFLSYFTLQKIFTHCWVPGERQEKYALKLGFKKQNIKTGIYAADFEYYNQLGLKYADDKKKMFPRRFIYVGRYTFLKGLPDLWAAFIEWKKETSSNWELWCLGTGNLNPIEFDGIKHFGFVQPSDMEKFIQETGVFILPSHFEPWGVVLHEFAAAGFPLICSDAVGASEAFVRNGKNGFIFKKGNINVIKECFIKIASLKDEELIQMGNTSSELAHTITPHTWAETVVSILTEYKSE